MSHNTHQCQSTASYKNDVSFDVNFFEKRQFMNLYAGGQGLRFLPACFFLKKLWYE